MTVSFQVTGNLQAPHTTELTTTTETDVYVPETKGQYTVIGIGVANVDASNACRITVRWSDNVSAHVLYSGNVSAGETIAVPVVPIALMTLAADGAGAAKKLTAQAQNANDLVVTVISTITSAVRAQ